MDIIGHKHVVDFFDKVIEHNNLSHAYCFVGPEHVGKRTVAEAIAAKLLKVDVKALKNQPDYCCTERAMDEKTEKLKKDISIEQIRYLISLLSQSSFIRGGYKVSIIDHAEHLSVGASNALLKTLEEPKDDTVLFLIAQDETSLLPTIRSRCQMIYFGTVGEEMLKTFALSQHVDEAEAADMAHCAYGAPGLMVLWIKDPTAFIAYKEEVERFNSLKGKSFYEKIAAVESLFGDKTDHISAREDLTSRLNIWHSHIHEIIQNKSNFQDIVAWEHDMVRAKAMLAQNIHPRLLVEHLLLLI